MLSQQKDQRNSDSRPKHDNAVYKKLLFNNLGDKMYIKTFNTLIVIIVFACNFMAIKNAINGKESAFIWKVLGDGIFLIYVCTHLIFE